MPIYTYREMNTGTDVEVIRAFADYENPPEGDEIPEELRDKECKWERQIGDNTRVVRGPNWNGAKGYW